MAFDIIISPTNPIRFTESLDYPFGYNDENHPCYRQKYELGDNTSLQIRVRLLEEEEEEVPILEIYDAEYCTKIDEIEFELIETIIANGDEEIYRADIVFSELGEGVFYFKIGDHCSNLVEVAQKHRNTLRIDYRNSMNDFGIVFDALESSEMFTIRVEGTIQNFTPKNDDVIYNDQVRNATKLYGLPYNTFTLFIGAYSRGVGDYMLDIVNRAFSCDMVRVDNVWYEKTESAAEWDMTRADNFGWAGMSTEIMPARNKVMERIKIDENLNDNEIMIIQRYSNNYYNHVGDVILTNVFKKNCVLDYIAFERKNLPYTLKVGTTNGGSEIGEFYLDELKGIITIRHRFDAPQTIYLTGVDGENDFALVWDRYDKFFNPSGDGSEEPSGISKGAVWAWHGTMDELEEQFNIVTGLGRDGKDWQGWAIMDGQNGTADLRGRVVVGLNPDDSDFDGIGKSGGAKNKQLSVSEMPAHGHRLFGDQSRPPQVASNITPNLAVAKSTSTSGKIDEKYAMQSVTTGAVPATLGLSGSAGGSTPISLMNPYRVLVYIKKIS